MGISQPRSSLTLSSLPSTVCQGVSVRQRSLHSQKENQGGEEDPGAPVPTASVLRGEPPGEGVTGVYSWLTSTQEGMATRPDLMSSISS